MILFNTRPYAGRKVVATMIDYVVILAITVLYILTFGEPNEEGGKSVTGWSALLIVLPWFIYFIFTEWYFGATPGHKIVGLKVVSVDGSRLRFTQVFVRRFCDALEISWCFGLIAFILVLNSEQNQRLGDIAAKTLVIDKNDELKDPEFDFEKADVYTDHL